MMNIVDDAQKWACEYCTYLNFPSAQRCTICRSSKQWHLIVAHGRDIRSSSTFSPPPPQPPSDSKANDNDRGEIGGDKDCEPECGNVVKSGGDTGGGGFDSDAEDGESGEHRNNEGIMDIYQLASRTSAKTNETVGFDQQRQQQSQSNGLLWDPDAEKWACPVCTYLNYPRSLKCTQCGKRRQSLMVQQHGPVPVVTAQSSGRNSRSGSNAASGQPSPVPSEKALSPPPLMQHRPPSSSPPHTSTSTSKSNSLLDSRIIARKLQKWTCGLCTYENWPKSSRCIMCYVPKGATTRPNTPPGTSNANTAGRASGLSSPPTTGEASGGNFDAGKEKKRSLSSGKESGRKSPKNSSSSESVNSDHSVGSGAVASCSTASAAAAASFTPMLITSYTEQAQQQPSDTILEKTMRRLKRQLRDVDYLWLTALKAIAAGGLADCCDPVEAYLAAGGDPARCLTHGEVHILNRSIPSASFEAGQTLFHLAMIYRREDLLTLLLTCTDRPINAGRQIQRVPCHMSPESAAEIRRQIHVSLRQRKGEMAAYSFTEITTFSLPSAIYDLPPSIQAKLFDALLDRNVQKKLEEEYPIINWSPEVTDRLGSRLFALWNRMCGDCLLDSVLQATWGVFDSENSLRQALAESLADAADVFYPRWKEYETYLASLMHYTIEEDQFARDWDMILQLANKPGAALEQAHIFVLAHIIRRPIIVYGVRVVKSYYSGESIDYARFEGIYLPLLWESSFCSRSPICLSYTPGHFTALVPMEPDAYEIGAMAAHVREFTQPQRNVYLPLQDSDGQQLPIHFLNPNERGHDQALLRAWLDVCVTEGGLWCCKMRIPRLSPPVQQMVDDWLDYYRRLVQLHQAASAALTRYKENAASISQQQHGTKSSKSSNIRKATSPTSFSAIGGRAESDNGKNEGCWVEIGTKETQQMGDWRQSTQVSRAGEGGKCEGGGDEENEVITAVNNANYKSDEAGD